MELDMSRPYRVESLPGVACHVIGFAAVRVPVMGLDPDTEETYETGEYEDETDPDRVKVRMVGDDRVHEVDVAELTPIGDDDFCRECGQLGCRHGR